MDIEKILIAATQSAIQSLYDTEINPQQVQIQKTKKEFEGDLTIVVFPFVKMLRKKPIELGEELGKHLTENVAEVDAFNVVQGFLNLTISNSFWTSFFNSISGNENYGKADPTGVTKMVEYSSPNTNKPLHLGHLRNNFLGHSMSRIHQVNGHDVVKVQIINDRGIHICMSMLAWQKWGNGETPESAGVKGDHLVGRYYVLFNAEYRKQALEAAHAWPEKNFEGVSDENKTKYLKLVELIAEEEAKPAETEEDKKAQAKEVKKLVGSIAELGKPETAIIAEARDMLRKWEAEDEEVRSLWSMMNQWCYDGFGVTYETMGVDFDKLYYESDTFLLGRDVVKKGLSDGLFFEKEDGSVWVNLEEDGLDEKLLLRGDGTAVYMTQDIGTAMLRFEDYPSLQQLIYTVGNEQDHHFKVLFKILEKLGLPWAKECYHLSYGMVELPHGRMKSREGTIVDADEILQEVFDTAKDVSEEAQIKVEGISDDEKQEIYRTIGLGALKYLILKVDPKKTIIFDPAESIDFNGNTGPYIQMAYARSRSLLRKYGKTPASSHEVGLEPSERDLIKQLYNMPATFRMAGDDFSPALIANYVYDLVKIFNTFWHDVPVLKAEDETVKDFRVALSMQTGYAVKMGMGLLGIDVPERM